MNNRVHYVRTYLSVTNTLARHHYEIQQSNHLVVWKKAKSGGYEDACGTASIEGIWVGPSEFRMEDDQTAVFQSDGGAGLVIFSARR